MTMHTTMLSKPRVCNVFAGNRKDIRGLRFPEATLADNKDTQRNEATPIEDVCVMGVTFRSPTPLTPGKVHYLSAKGQDSTSLVSPLRIVSCRVRADGEFDVAAEFF
jgi:hypothetical protein